MVPMLLIMSTEQTYSNEERNTLLELASKSIRFGLSHNTTMPISTDEYSESLRQERATFVTLKINSNLRGCIGTLEAHRPLAADVIHNAHAAAFSDPRFPPLTENEFDKLELHISILNPAEEMEFSSEKDLKTQLRPGIDGLILTEGHSRSTFLPSVWESLTSADDFLCHLKLKAGLPANYWSETINFKRYTTTSIP